MKNGLPLGAKNNNYILFSRLKTAMNLITIADDSRVIKILFQPTTINV